MKYIICFAIIGIMLFAYRSDDHKHIWVESLKDTVVIGAPGFSNTLEVQHRPMGKHAGTEIVCVKCFAIKRQILDYGNDGGGHYLQFPAGVDTSLFLSGQSTIGTTYPMFINLHDILNPRSPGK